MKSLIKVLLLVIALSFLQNNANAQCKWFNNKFCLPELPPYTPNGQLLTAVFSPGDVTEIKTVFTKNKDYRIMICHQDVIGSVFFKIKSKGKVLFDSTTSKKKEDKPFPYFDIKMTSTRKLTLEVGVESSPELVEGDVKPKGCVTIAIGYKKK